jgi:ADP-dependent NAD(P)H-hydrate dehydratase / NAD(P)H-hydrate epimerase
LQYNTKGGSAITDNHIMKTLPKKLYRAEQTRELDRIAIEDFAISGYELMSRAGQAAFQLILRYWPHGQSLAVYCGSGNNAGDGYIVARLAMQAGLRVTVYTMASPNKLHGDALTAFQDYQRQQGEVVFYQGTQQIQADLIVDALLGTGLDREVTGIYAAAIGHINALQKPVIALDIPSGLNADTGCVMGCAVSAARTITFIGLKQGLFTADAADYCGTIHFSSLQIPGAVFQQIPPAAQLIEKKMMPPRSRCAHKGNHGHVLVIGGDLGFSGAIKMAAEAAARVGAGLVSLATRIEHAGYCNINRPELMCHGVENAEQLRPLLDKASVIVIGPGLGQSPWAVDLFQAVMQEQKTLLIDADGLNLLANHPVQYERSILTPHPGEASRLLQCSTVEIQRDRFASVAALQKKYAGTIVLKGTGSLITDGNEIFVSTTGNPGMATGGMGDVLSGVIAGLLAQGMEQLSAVKMGVYIHGEAADIAAKDGERGLLASDLMPHLRRLVNQP